MEDVIPALPQAVTNALPLQMYAQLVCGVTDWVQQESVRDVQLHIAEDAIQTPTPAKLAMTVTG